MKPGDIYEVSMCSWSSWSGLAGREFHPVKYEERQILEVDGNWALVLHPPKRRKHGNSKLLTTSRSRCWTSLDSIRFSIAKAKRHRDGDPCEWCEPGPQSQTKITEDSPTT